MSRQILAIDIRTTTIAAVLLNTGLKSNVVQKSLFVPLKPSDQNGHALADGLDAIFQQFDVTGAIIIAAIPSHQVFYRTLQVPFKDEKKIRQILPFEIESFMPVNVDRLVIDFQKGSENETNRILATAIEQKTLEFYLDLFNSRNRPIQLVVPGPLPTLINLLASTTSLPSDAVLLDVDSAKATLYAIQRGDVTLVRSLSADLQSDSAVETLALQIRQTLAAYSDSDTGTMIADFIPQALYLSGPALRDESKRQALGAALGWPIACLDVRHLSSKVDVNGSLEPYNPWLMDNALALALIEAEGKSCPSFHRSSSPLRDFWTSYRSVIITPTVITALILILGFSSLLLGNYLLQQRVNQIDAQIKAVFQSVFPNIQSSVPPLEHMKSKLKEIQTNISAPVQDGVQIRSIDIFYEISRLIPKEIDVHFNRMVIGPETISISGRTSAFNIVDDVKSRLEQSQLFKQVEISSATMDKSGQTVNFKFTINL